MNISGEKNRSEESFLFQILWNVILYYLRIHFTNTKTKITPKRYKFLEQTKKRSRPINYIFFTTRTQIPRNIWFFDTQNIEWHEIGTIGGSSRAFILFFPGLIYALLVALKRSQIAAHFSKLTIRLNKPYALFTTPIRASYCAHNFYVFPFDFFFLVLFIDSRSVIALEMAMQIS